MIVIWFFHYRIYEQAPKVVNYLTFQWIIPTLQWQSTNWKTPVVSTVTGDIEGGQLVQSILETSSRLHSLKNHACLTILKSFWLTECSSL